jgi:hypothetical protein
MRMGLLLQINVRAIAMRRDSFFATLTSWTLTNKLSLFSPAGIASALHQPSEAQFTKRVKLILWHGRVAGSEGITNGAIERVRITRQVATVEKRKIAVEPRDAVPRFAQAAECLV